MFFNIILSILYLKFVYLIIKYPNNFKKIFESKPIFVALIVLALIVSYNLFIELRDFNKLNKKRSKMPDFANECPDQWSKVNRQCVNDFNIGGKCGSTNFDNYSKKQKCKWSKKCQAPWEGIDDIC